MHDNHLERKRLETAIILARMYGIKETLEPLQCISNKKMIVQIEKWTEEYLESELDDIIRFFEGRFEKT